MKSGLSQDNQTIYDASRTPNTGAALFFICCLFSRFVSNTASLFLQSSIQLFFPVFLHPFVDAVCM